MSDGSPEFPKDYKFNADVKSTNLAPIILKVKKQMNVMNVLHAYAMKMEFGLIILSAVGAVRNVVLPLNTKKNYDEGVFKILSLSGKTKIRKTGEITGNLNLIMSDVHGATVGGVVKSLIAETTVEVTAYPFYHDTPKLYGKPYLPSSSKPSSSDESCSSREQSLSGEYSP